MKPFYIKNATILVIDDNPTNLDILYNCLSTMGARILAKKDGESGIDIATRKQPDIILLDIIMPNIDGYETCRRLKANKATQDIPVIFASALIETLDKIKGFEVGAVDYITKPFQVEEVVARIEIHLSLTRLRQQLEIKNEQLHQEIERRKQIEQDLNKVQYALEKANQCLYKLTILDGLTQIANRRQFDNYLTRQWQTALHEQQPLALILCDIDHFKQYNDTYGHQAGDNCLKQVAQIIEQVLNRPDDLVARYGSEEFGIILPNTPISVAIEISQLILQAVLDLHIDHENSSVANCVTVSLGVNSLTPTIEYPLQNFIEVTDRALYQAKKLGRNRFVVSI